MPASVHNREKYQAVVRKKSAAMLFPLYDRNPHKRLPVLTVLLILANVWVTWQASQLPERRQAELMLKGGFIPVRLTKLDNPQPQTIVQPLLDANGQPDAARPPIRVDLPSTSRSVYATLITSLFLHGGWLHLITNMWMLWVFGNNIEDRLGHFVFIAFYLVGGVIATMSHWAIDPGSQTPVIGASGAVAAVLGGYALTYPWVKVRTLLFIGIPLLLDIPAFIVLGLWMIGETIAGVMQLQLGLAVGVAHWAHIGGFVAGLIVMPLLAIGTAAPGEDWNKETDQLFQFGDEPRQD